MASPSTSMKAILVVTATLEAATGVGLLVGPSLLMQVLVGASLDAPAGLVVARVAGVALLAVGLACWFARHDGSSRAARGLVAALLLYNAGAVVALVHARIGMGLSGAGLLPTVLVHLVLAAWCIACLRNSRADATQHHPPARSNARSLP